MSTLFYSCEDLKQARATDRETIERQNQQLSEYEAEINVLRRRIEQLENDRERDKKEIARLTDALNRARIVSNFLLPSISKFISCFESGLPAIFDVQKVHPPKVGHGLPT